MATASPPSNISQGVIEAITGKTPTKATDKIVNGKSTTQADPNKKAPETKYVVSPKKNPLEDFASYSAVWTMACLTKDQFNKPETYRKTGDLKNIVFSSAGRFDEKRVKTAYGVPEYYINKFMMKTIIGANQKTGNSNAVKFEWEIFEPYSMGLLLQSLQIAARSANFLNYLDNAPFCLKLDFVGFGEDQALITSIKSKYFVVKITNVSFQVTESGSVYKMEGIPYNHQAFSDEINTMYQDIKLVADEKGTVEELLSSGKNSLQSVLNGIEADMVFDEKILVPDEYEIVFPKKSNDFIRIDQQTPKTEDKKATADPSKPTDAAKTITGKSTVRQFVSEYDKNNIGPSEFGFDQSDGGNYSFRRPGFQYDAKTGIVVRDNMSINPKERSFLFSQGQSIIAIINQVILSSKYAKEGIVPDKDGFITWWKIDVQVELLQLDNWTGDFARKYTFRVVPYRIHHTIFSNPNAAAIGYEQLAKEIVKSYDYIYTGQNINVLKFDIDIKNMFFTGINPALESRSSQTSDPNRNGPAEKTNNETKTGEGAANNAKAANFGRKRVKKDPALLARAVGGAGTKDVEQKVAEAFHTAFTDTTTELIKVNVEVLGDPYWLVDSGYANYFANKASEKSQETDDGTMNYESGDVFIYVSFQTPADIDEPSGLYLFSKDYGRESPFSGIYRVVACENTFTDGTFKQRLECIRMPGQANEFKDIKPEERRLAKDAATSGAIQTGGAADPPKTSPTDSPTTPKTNSNDNIERVDTKTVLQAANNKAISAMRSAGAVIAQAEAVGQAIGNTAGAKALVKLTQA